MKTKEYPELDNIAEEISEVVAFMINQRTAFGKIDRDVREDVRYPAQYVLEELIERLEGKV